MKSEADVQADRTKLSWNEDTHWKYDDGFENNFRKAFNDFLDTQWEKTQLLRRLDAQFSNLKENLQLLDEVINKKWDLKDNAKNKILKWDEETLNQMESIFPGIKKLVELTRISSSIVNKVRDAKMKYREANSLFTSWWRYMAVLAGSTAWWALMFGWRGIPIAAFAFVWLERLWTAGKRKLWKKELDRDLYNKYIDLLNVDWNTKAKFKQEQLRLINEQIKLAKWKTDSQVQKTLDEALEILTLRKTNEIIQRKKRENERKQIEDQRRLEEWNRSQQPINNALPWMKPDIATAEWEITLWIWNPINPETLGAKWVKPQPKPIKEVKETYKDKEKTQQWYNEAEQRVLDMSQGVVEKEFSPEAEKLADVLEETIDNTASIIKKSAKNNLEERWEELTDENIAKEIQKEPSSIEEFIMETEKWAPEETTNYDGADIKDLEEVVANPKKYPNVDIEAAKAALEKARRQNIEAEIMQSPDQQQAQKEIAWIYKGNQMEREWNKGREKQREDMVRETNRDFNTLETTEEYDRIESQITPEKWEQAKKYAKWYKGFYRSDKAKTDTLRADMGKKPSQNITRTSSVEQIATLDNPKSRARVAQEKLNKRKRLSEEEKTQLNQIIEQANTEIQAKEELKAQKTELANEYKRLDKKRSETPYRETKKEITKQMDKISDEFDKLTYEEQGQFAKPKEVEAEEIKEAERIEEERQNLDMNETPQKAEPEIKEQETKKESEWERSFWDEEYTNRDNKIEEMSKDESVTIKDTINEIDEIVWWWIKDYQEKIYWEKRDKEESYTNDWAESFRNKVNDKIRERDKKFWEDQRSKTKDMESSKLTKEQEKQLEEAKTKEEKDALMNKWRKEYIERNPIAEEYLKEAEEHNKQFQKAMDAFDKISALTRRIRRKNAEKITRAYEERKKKRAEEERQNLDMNETPQIDEIPQEVSPEKVVEWKKETKTDKLSMDDLKWDAPIETKNKVTDILNDTTDNIVENIQKWKSVKETSDKNIYWQEVPKDIKNRAWEWILKNNKWELVPIFHWSNSKFTIEEFDENRAVSWLWWTNGWFWMFFAIRYEYAEWAWKFITDRKKWETNVMECYSNIKNPILHPQYIVEKLSYDPVTADTLLMDYYRKVWRMDYLDEIHDFAESEWYESLVDALWDKLLMEWDQWRNAEFRWDTVKEKQILQKLWYDSIIFSEENFTIAIFDPKKNVKQTNQETGKNKGWDKPEEPTTPKKPEPNKPTWWTPLVDVAKDGTVNKEPGLWDYTTDQIQKRIDELKKKRLDNWKKLYAQDLSELRVLQDLLKRQIERENREEWSTELTDRQREILNSNNYGDQYRAGWAWVSED